jgi:hypothetical protein
MTTGSRGVTEKESQTNAVREFGWIHNSYDDQADDTPNLCRRVLGATV